MLMSSSFRLSVIVVVYRDPTFRAVGHGLGFEPVHRWFNLKASRAEFPLK